MGFFTDLVDAFSDLREGICDIAEYVTVGFVEEVVKGNGEYKTSYEKRDEASEIYAAANRRLKNASESLNQTVESLNEKILNLNSRKRQILSGMKCGVSVMPCSLPTSYSASGYSSTFNGLSERSDLISTGMRISLANEYLEDARDHRAECDEKIARINSYKLRLEAVENVLDEETRLLDILERSQNFQYSANSTEIAEKLQQLLTQHICNTDGELDSSYIQSINVLKALCGRL